MHINKILRNAQLFDIEHIVFIYNDSVLNNTATFDIEPKTVSQMKDWFHAHDEKFCVIVCEIDNQIAGWASLTRYSDRTAYDRTAEFSIYLHPSFKGQKLSKPLMEYCLNEGHKHGVKAVLARITQGNDISIKLHEHFGFFMVGVLKQVGVKFNKVLDVNLMQLLVE